MENMFNLKDKLVLITGASDGIGKETSILFSKYGARVILIGRDEEKLADTLSKMEGEGHKAYSADLSETESIEPLIKKIVEENGKIDNIFHSAGISNLMPLKSSDYSWMHKNMLINFYAFVELVRVYANQRINNDGGSVVVMSSVAGFKGDKGKLAYCASKAAVDGAVRAMAIELADKKIRVNSIVGGMINTRMYSGYVTKYGEEAAKNNIFDKQFLGVVERDEIANGVAYLMSDMARSVTGTAFRIDGGFLV